MIIQAMNAMLEGCCALPHLGVIRAQGEDATSFLQGQLTQDFALLGPERARLAAYCSAKGRMLASFVGFKRAPDDIWLVVSRDLLPATLKRLSMFVLRAKVRLTDASDDVRLLGLAGDMAVRLGGAAQAPWTRQDDGSATLVHLYPAGGVPRVLWAAPDGTALPEGPALDPALWLWSEVRSGVATVTQPLVDALVPQMLNYESVDGVNFKKGCYPGQEVVARSQFRGTLKRRGYLVHAAAALQVGEDVYSAADPEQPCGVVAQAAPAPGGGWDALVSMQVSAAEGALRCGAEPGNALSVLPLPYVLRDDI